MAGELIFNTTNGGMTIRPKIVDNGTGAVSLTVRAAPGQQFQLAATGNTYSGGTYVAGGVLRATEPTTLGTGPVRAGAGGQIYLDPFNATTPETSVFNNEIFLSGVGVEGSGGLNQGAMRLSRQAVLAGNVNLLTDSRIQFRLTTGAGVRIDGKVTGPHALKLGGGGTSQLGTLTLTNSANDWTGNTSIDIGAATKVGGSGEVIPNGPGKGDVFFSANSGTFDLNANTETINALNGRVPALDPLDQHTVRNSGATPGTLIVGDNNASGSFGGHIIGSINLSKIGTGVQTLVSFYATSNNWTGATSVSGGKLLIAGTDDDQQAIHHSDVTKTSSVSVTGGTLELAPLQTRVLRTPSVSVTGTGCIDIQDNKLITQTAVGTATAGIYDGVSGLIQSGRTNDGGWDGSGIVTSQTAATTGSLTSIGIATAAQAKLITATDTAVWAGQTVTGSDTLVMYTYGGDANLDGKVNVDDYGRIDSNIGLGTAGWYNGDFNYDGKVNVDDYGVIDSNIGIQGAPFPTATGAGASLSALSAVPEPTALSSAALIATACALRRRRCRRSNQPARP
jgi:autotransporter-associated beta strand protein